MFPVFGTGAHNMILNQLGNRAPTGSFPFPFAPLSLGLFDTDPSRILNLLHHQSLLAEEALRYRNLLFGTKDTMRAAPLTEMLLKDPEYVLKRSQYVRDSSTPTDYSNPFKNIEMNIRFPEQSPTTLEMGSFRDKYEHASTSRSNMESYMSKKLDDYSKNNPGPSRPSSKSSSSISSPMIKARPEIELLSDSLNLKDHQQEEAKCHICMANFPTTWLLEQHTALQHSSLLTGDDKPYSCNLCGETFRYNCCKFKSAYAKHKELSQRPRLPADKLFTCDVCGMQFRYLKSFKKHRLNHALERLHGKKDKTGGDSSELVSSTNESEGVDLRGVIKDEENLSDCDDQDEERDSPAVQLVTDSNASDAITVAMEESQSKITSSINEFPPSKMSRLDEKPQHRIEPESTIPSTSVNQTLNTLINAETIPNQHLLGLNPQEASILNFLRVDAAEKQRDRRFACPFCGKCVRSKENLKLHVRKHTGERPFVCLFCGRAFGGKSDLTRHLRIHTGERPYHCEACGKCFARADYLSKHLTTHVHNAPR